MDTNGAKECVKYVMSLGETPILVGHAGVGKTEIVKQIGAETGRRVIVLMLSQMEPGDLLGFPAKDDSTGKTKYYAPDWWPEDGQTIVFLDEINRAHITVRNAVMQLLLDRRIHNNILPKGTWVCAAMNPDTSDYEVEPVIDKAFIDRFVWIKVKPNYEAWRNFMLQHKRIDAKFEQAVSAVLRHDMTIFVGEDFQLPDINCTPRALERLYKVLSDLPAELNEYIEELSMGICGKVGVKIVKEFLEAKANTLTFEHLVNGDEESVKKATSQERIKALDGLMSYFMAEFDGRRLNVPTEKIANAVRCLAHYNKEELGPLFRVANETHASIINELKKCKEFRAFFTNLITSFGDLALALEKMR